MISGKQAARKLHQFSYTLHLSSLTRCGLVMPYGDIDLNLGSGNGFLPDGTKPLPEQMQTNYQYNPVSFPLRQKQLEMLMKVIATTHLKITHMKSQPHPQGTMS